MKIQNVILIEPRTPKFNFFNFTNMPLLGLPLLGTILKNKGFQVKIFCENISPVDWQAVKKADLICFTLLTNLAPRAYELAAKAKKINPESKIIMGGVHATFCPEEALKNGADYVVRQEGEETLPALINCLQNDKYPQNIQGISFRKNGDFIHTPKREQFQDLNSLPTPDFSLIDNFQNLNYVPIQTSRGCPHNCEFCSVVQMFGRDIRYRNSDLIVKDLEKISQYYNLNKQSIFFVDDNFSINQDRTEVLLKKLTETEYNLTWSTQEEVRLYKKENILNLMEKAGCNRLHIGIESFSSDSLAEYNKPQSQKEVEKVIKTIHEHNIAIHGMFVLGSDQDTEKSILNTLKKAVTTRIDTAQFFVLVPIPGTRVYEKLKEEKRILIDKVQDWSFFDGHHVVFEPKNMSPYKLQKLQLKAFNSFYNLKNSFRWLKERKFKNFYSTLYGRWALGHWKRKSHSFLNKLKKNYS